MLFLYSKHIDLKKFKVFLLMTKKRLKQAIEKKLAVDPVHFGKPLRKSLYGSRSLRVGEYRIIYRIQKDIVEILLFGHRSTIYSDAEDVM